MSMTFTDVDTGNPIVLPNNSVQAGYESEDFCVLELLDGSTMYVSGPWSYVNHQLSGGAPI